MPDLPSACPRCSTPLETGCLDAGKGPLRWDAGEPKKSIFGGNLLLNHARVWGYRRAEARRCRSCHLVLFQADPNAKVVNFTER